MRAPAADLPIVLEEVSVVARGVTILDRIALTLTPGAPTVLIGPNGAGKTTLMRLAMGLISPTRGRVTWGGREQVAPTHRAIAARGIKVMMSTHDLAEAKRLAGEIVLMHRGRIVESGAANAFFAAPRTTEASRFIAGELLL